SDIFNRPLGARKPMRWSILIAALGLSMAAMTFLPDAAYIVVVFIGFLIGGIGVGMYATPSMDTVLVHISNDQVGIASGIYKMASSLGSSFGIAISTAIYGTVQLMMYNIHAAGAMGILTAFVFRILSFWVVSKTISPEEGLSDSFEVAS